MTRTTHEPPLAVFSRPVPPELVYVRDPFQRDNRGGFGMKIAEHVMGGRVLTVSVQLEQLPTREVHVAPEWIVKPPRHAQRVPPMLPSNVIRGPWAPSLPASSAGSAA